jgi:hypothetical protein
MRVSNLGRFHLDILGTLEGFWLTWVSFVTTDTIGLFDDGHDLGVLFGFAWIPFAIGVYSSGHFVTGYGDCFCRQIEELDCDPIHHGVSVLVEIPEVIHLGMHVIYNILHKTSPKVYHRQKQIRYGVSDPKLT